MQSVRAALTLGHVAGTWSSHSFNYSSCDDVPVFASSEHAAWNSAGLKACKEKMESKFNVTSNAFSLTNCPRHIIKWSLTNIRFVSSSFHDVPATCLLCVQAKSPKVCRPLYFAKSIFININTREPLFKKKNNFFLKYLFLCRHSNWLTASKYRSN